MDNATPVIPNGKFTIHSQKTGEHRTFKISTSRKNARFVSLLTGPDNQTNYESFAVVSDDWQKIHVFKRLRGETSPSMWETYACVLECMLMNKDNGYYEKLGMTIQGSRKCAKCGKELTEPESIAIGIGPYCRKNRT